MSFGLSAGTILGGAQVVSGLLGADAAGDAADAQVQAAKLSDETQRYFYDTTRKDNAPFLANGTAASNRLAFLLGLTPSYEGGASTAVDRDAIRARLLPQFTTAAAAPAVPTSGGSAMFGGELGSTETTNGAGPVAAGAQSTVDEAALNAAIEREIAGQRSASQPAGQTSSDPAFGSLLRNFTLADLNADPVYKTGLQFGLDEGTKGINRQAAATGSSLSGATLKALTRFGNDYGTTKANDAFNRFNVNRDSTYNKLAGVAGSGQTASAQVGAAGANAGNQISASQQGAGNARAAGYVGAANAVTGGVGSAINGYQNSQLLNRIFPQTGTTGSGGGLMDELTSYGVFQK